MKNAKRKKPKRTMPYIRAVLDRLTRRRWPDWKQQFAYEQLCGNASCGVAETAPWLLLRGGHSIWVENNQPQPPAPGSRPARRPGEFVKK